jgi:hypothetical protein
MALGADDFGAGADRNGMTTETHWVATGRVAQALWWLRAALMLPIVLTLMLAYLLQFLWGYDSWAGSTRAFMEECGVLAIELCRDPGNARSWAELAWVLLAFALILWIIRTAFAVQREGSRGLARRG